MRGKAVVQVVECDRSQGASSKFIRWERDSTESRFQIVGSELLMLTIPRRERTKGKKNMYSI